MSAIAPLLDLPLEDTPASRFLRWILAGLVYLAVLALAVAAIADAAVRLVEQRPVILTVTLPPPTDREAGEAEVRKLLAFLDARKDVAFATIVSDEELTRLVESWVPNGSATARLPLPRLIDVTFQPGMVPDAARLSRDVGAVVPGASVSDAGPGDPGGEGTARVLRAYGGGGGALVLIVTVLVVIIVTRMSLDLHDETVDLLRLMGAPDRYVARQFEQHALAQAVKGSVLGFLAAVLTILTLIHVPLIGLAAVLPVQPRALDWLLLAMVPVGSAIIAGFGARFTALWGLRRLR